MLNKLKNYFKENMESIAMCMATINGEDYYPFLQ